MVYTINIWCCSSFDIRNFIILIVHFHALKVARLKEDIANVHEEIIYQQSGVEKLEKFDEILRTENSNLEAQIGRVNELKNIEQSVDSEEKQRQKLIQDLIVLKKKFSFQSGSEESGSEKVCL